MHASRNSDTSHTGPIPARSELRRAYDVETGRLIRRRVSLAALIYVFAISVYGMLDVHGAPAHAHALAFRIGSHALICVVGVLAIRSARFDHYARAIAAVFAAAVTLAGSVYNASVGTPAERYAMYLVCLLSGMAVLFPWGWSCQAVGAIASVTAFVAAAPWLTGTEGPAHCALALTVVSATTVVGAHFLDRSRFDAFVQTGLQREEAEVSAALVRVGEGLSVHLHEPDVIERVNGLVRELVGCDATATFVWRPARDAFLLAAAAGVDDPAVLEALTAVALPRRAPLIADLVPGELLEPSPSVWEDALPMGLLAAGCGRRLVAPMARGDEILGLVLLARATGADAFAPPERRLALGIAHTAAIALENARLIADLQGANQLKSEFVSTMSHELRTPLNVILGFTDMARDGELPSAERDRCLARVDAAARDLLTLVEDTLEIGRMEAGRDYVRLEPVGLRGLWGELGDAAMRMPRAAGVALDWSDAVPDVSVVTDPRKITVIVRNLVGNALKFTARGSVRADVTVDDALLVVRIADTGIGIRPEDQKVIFEMFRQADGSDSRQYGGVGLGLHIVRRTVDQLGGMLALESARGHGSVFTVRLPVARGPACRAA